MALGAWLQMALGAWLQMALGDRLQMQEPISATLRISKFVARWQTSVNVIRDYGEK
jgi:hypothetical protein